MNIKIIDDCKTDADRLMWMCNLYFKQQKKEKDAIEPVYEIITDYHPGMDLTADLLFLDIEMPGMSGLEIKEALEEQSCMGKRKPYPYIIFVTSHGRYMPNAFGKHVIAFLQKPVEIIELELALERVVKQLESRRTVDCGDGASVHLQEIRYIQADHVYTSLYLDGGERIVRRSLKEWQELLKDEGFCRISDQVLVSLRWVDDVYGMEVCLKGSKERFTISRRKKKELKDAMKNYQERTVQYV